MELKDKEFLEWLRDRLHYQHNEKLNVDYMMKLQAIIDNTEESKVTPNIVGTNWTGFEN